jgi:pyruvate kinase
VMLSGETANGIGPANAVSTMAAIAANAELGVDTHFVFREIQRGNLNVSAIEAVCKTCVRNTLVFSEDIDGDGVVDATEGALLIVITSTGEAAALVSKYRPCCPIVVATDKDSVVRQTSALYAQYPFKLDLTVGTDNIVREALEFAARHKLVADGKMAVVLTEQASGDSGPRFYSTVVGGGEQPQTHVAYRDPSDRIGVVSMRATKIALQHIATQMPLERRQTKIFCTLGPACWSEEGLGSLLDAGLNVARFNFSHGDHPGHQGVLDRFRKVCAAKGSNAAVLLDTKGPEIRTAMLKDGKDIMLEKGQDITIVAAGDEYTSYEGFKDEETGETVIGCSYARLAQTVKPGNRLLFADGSVVIEITDIVDEKTVKGKCMNSKKLGQRKNGNLPGVKVDMPVLQPKDIDDLQNFACKNKMDYVAISFVQSGEDVQFVRRVLDEAGGQNIQIISKIENEEGLVNFDEILEHTDGVMVARGDLGMEIPSEKVPLAQKWMITKCNIAGKFVVTATQMLESMCDNPLPTRAEMTDVANAVFDGTDCVMLSGETANGIGPANAVSTMAAIAANAEIAVNWPSVHSFLRDFTPKPFSNEQSIGRAVATLGVDAKASLAICVSDDPTIICAIAKFRSRIPVMLVTQSVDAVRRCGAVFGLHGCLIDASMTQAALVEAAAVQAARTSGLFSGGEVIVLDSELCTHVTSWPEGRTS